MSDSLRELVASEILGSYKTNTQVPVEQFKEARRALAVADRILDIAADRLVAPVELLVEELIFQIRAKPWNDYTEFVDGKSPMAVIRMQITVEKLEHMFDLVGGVRIRGQRGEIRE